MSSRPPHFLDLGQERRLAWEESGAAEGEPIFFFHGWPASRLQGAGFSVEAEELGARIISPDRPGIGLSTFQPGRRLLDWPELVEKLADHLGFERFRLLAISGGGPYAFATAWQLGSRVISATVASGAPPLPPETNPTELMAIYRWMLRLYRTQPALLRQMFRLVRGIATIRPPRWLWPSILRITSPPSDRAALQDPQIFDGSFECYAESWRSSGLGVAADGEIYAEPWGFDPSEIQVPIRLWHGKEDRNFSWRLVEKLSRLLPNCQPRFVEGEGHFSLPIQRRREILTDLLNTPARP